MESSDSSSSTPLFQGTTETLLNLCEVVEMKVNEIQSDQEMGEVKNIQPEWLVRFFDQKFFVPCSEHTSVRNELNKYCIDCDKRLCQYCLSEAPDAHDGHRLLKIYRHVYKDVVPLDDIKQHVDCSNIQPYRCNKQRVVAVSPLPHMGSKTYNVEELCVVCKRKLIDHNSYCYCSVQCKAEAFATKSGDDVPPYMLPVQPVEEANQEPDPTPMTVDESAEEAQPEPELESAEEALLEPEPEPKSAEEAQNEPEPAEEAQHEPEPKLKSAEEAQHDPEPEPKSAEEAQHEPEPQTEMLDEPIRNPEAGVSYRKRRRKGTPHRAPFF